MQEQNKQELSFVKYFLINQADELKKKKYKGLLTWSLEIDVMLYHRQ